MSAREPHTVRKSVLVPYSAEQMYELVDRVEDYPKFLPWCGGSEVRRQSETESLATVHIDFHGVRQKFTTANTMEPGRSIRMALRDGPFSDLNGEWTFEPLREDACKVQFFLQYRFAGGLLGRLLAPVFDRIARTFVDSFVRRADSLYRR